jgi:glycosyltransferase involved in cell wall biosynthesis
MQGVGTWDPDRVASGIAGSEEAVIYMSQQLAKLGYQVTVYCPCPNNSRHSRADANPRFVDFAADDDRAFDIAIAWRAPWAGDILRPRGRKLYLWPHDTLGKFEHIHFTDEQIKQFDDVLWLSKWQREQYANERPAFGKFTKCFGNGINPEQFRPIQPRANPYACIYASSYDRGLEVLLDNWPYIKKRFPQATLDIYYGWPSVPIENEAKMRQQLLGLASMGVQEHGRVGHEELTRAFERASLWTYPSTFQETFCITALRAQLAGCVPVVVKQAALHETVRHGYSCDDSIYFVKTLLEAMRNAEQITLEDRKKMGEFVLKEYTWSGMARQWHELFNQPNEEVLCVSSS